MRRKIESIWKSCSRELRHYIVRRISDSSYADDILQEVFIKVHSKIDTLKDETKICAWLYQITQNTIIDYYRKPKVKHDDIQDFEELIPADENINNEISPADEIAAGIKEMIQALPEKYAEALLLVEFEGLSQVQLAEKLGISFSGAKSRVQRARQMLKDSLMRCCHYEFDKYGTIINYCSKTCCYSDCD